MTDTPLQLAGPLGQPIGTLGIAALALASKAEEVARDHHLAKRTALPLVLREYLESTGYEVGEAELAAAVDALEKVRRGEALSVIQIRVGSSADYRKNGLAHSSGKHHIERKREPMVATLDSPNMIAFFEAERIYPDVAAQRWYERLVGLDDHKARLLIELEMLLYPERLEQWSKRHHMGQVLRICELYGNRVPLILLEGDVGTGKTALAETIGDALARRIGSGRQVHMLKINTQIRGTGQVGEMSDLIVQSFVQVEDRARVLGGDPVLLLLDEADALAVSRETQQMHHEDKAGLNTLLQRLDKLRLTKLPIAALFITNRPEALDPAIRRRAALDLHFTRPGDDIRAQILLTSVPELGLREAEAVELVRLTGPHEPKNKGVPFTASDLTDRLLPAALRRAYSERRALEASDLLEQAQILEPTPLINMIR
jgi:AAA+ superfamily predicted ATPase